MDEKILYVLLGLAYLAFQYFGNLKKKQREAEKNHPPPPRRDESPDTTVDEDPPMLTLEDILKRAAEESRRAREAKKAEQQKRELQQQQRQQTRSPQPQRTWVSEKPKPIARKADSPFLTQDNAGYRAPQMEAITTLEGNSLEGSSLETFGEEGGISISDVHNPIETVVLDEPAPTINLRQAMLHQVVLQRPEY